MRRVPWGVIVLLIVVLESCQVLRRQHIPAQAHLTALKSNLLYIGLENPIEVRPIGIDSNRVALKLEPSSLGEVRLLGPCQFSVKATQSARNGGYLIAYDKSDPDQRPMGSWFFYVKPIPHPIPQLDQHVGSTITAIELGKVRQLNLRLENFAYSGLRFKATGYYYRYIRAGSRKNVYQGEIQGSTIGPSLKRIFSEAKPGDVLVISQIKAQCQGLVDEYELPHALVLEVR